MRVLLINTSERTGGAAIAAGRLMDALRNSGIKAKLLVRDKQTDKISVVKQDHTWLAVWSFVWERIVIWTANRFSKENIFAIDIANTGMDVTSLPEFKQADIIHLHWINQGMLSLKNIQKILHSGKPVVWTLHDMWPLTGICHHARECDSFQTTCHNCPYLNYRNKKDLANRVFFKKKRIYHKNQITFVGCSQWISNKAAVSALTANQHIEHIPNAINTHVFKKTNKNKEREAYRLPHNKKLILFGSVKVSDKRKGIDYLADACSLLVAKYPGLRNSLGVVVFGHHSEELQAKIPFEVYSMDYVKTEQGMAGIYNAVDIFVTPSLEENLPNTVMEAMACGIPCVGFQTGGIPEMIDHLHNGYVAKYKSADDLANGIHWLLTEADYQQLSEQAVSKVMNNYTERAIAKKYIDLYNRITDTHQ